MTTYRRNLIIGIVLLLVVLCAAGLSFSQAIRNGMASALQIQSVPQAGQPTATMTKTVELESTATPTRTPTVTPSQTVAPTATASPTALLTTTATPGTLVFGATATAAPTSDCNPANHAAQIKKVNDLIAQKGLAQALTDLGVTGSLNTLTDQDTFVHEGTLITGIKFFPATNLSAPWPMVIATPNGMTGFDAKVDLGNGSSIYRGGTLANGGGVLWFSGYSWPQFCAQPSGSIVPTPVAGSTITTTGTFTGTGRLAIQPNPLGRHVDTAQAKVDLKLDVQRLETEIGDAFVRRIVGLTDAKGQQMTETLACPSGYICTITHPGGAVQVYIGTGTTPTDTLKLVETAMTARVISSYPGEDAVYYPCELAKKENAFGLGENPSFPAQSGNFACNAQGQFTMTANAPAPASGVTPCPKFGGVQTQPIENGAACKLAPQAKPIKASVPTGFTAEYWDGKAVQQAAAGDSITTGEATFRPLGR